MEVRFTKVESIAKKQSRVSRKLDTVDRMANEAKVMAQESKKALLNLQAEIESKKLTLQDLEHEISLAALRGVRDNPPPIKTWNDVDRADRIGRRSLGMEKETRKSALNLALLAGKIEVRHVHGDNHEPKGNLSQDKVIAEVESFSIEE